jgi:hypothetical protein
MRLYAESLSHGKPKPITEEGGFGDPLTQRRPRRRQRPDRKIYLDSTAGGEPRGVPGTEISEVPTGWCADGRELSVIVRGQIPAPAFRLDIATGKRSLWKALEAADSAGIGRLGRVLLSSDNQAYIYS